MFKTLVDECSEFINETYPYPLLKNLPIYKDGFIKLKIRHKKNKKYVESKTLNIFNEAFEQFYKNVTFKALYAYPQETLEEGDINTEPFYIFPVDGYKYLYNTMVTSSHNKYNDILLKIENDHLENVFKDIIKDSYCNESLKTGISCGSEIIFFDIPYYYAIRQSLIEVPYEDFLRSSF